MSPPRILLTRADEDGPGLSKQNTIIVAVCAACGGIVLAYILWRVVRNRNRRPANPLPPPQPLAHHRERQVAQLQESARLATWYEPQHNAVGHPRLMSAKNSKASLLGIEPPSPTRSIPPSSEDVRELSIADETDSRYLPPPNASFHLNRPGSRSSLVSSEASCTTNPHTPDSSTHASGRGASGSPAPPPTRRQRPLSMSSTNTHHTTMSRRSGVPHAPYNQIQIILPTPLASANNSRETLPRLRHGRFDSDATDRRSIADPWINLGHGSYGEFFLPLAPQGTRN